MAEEIGKMLCVAEAALLRDLAKREVGAAQKETHPRETLAPDFLAGRTSQFLDEAPVEPDGRNPQRGGELLDAP